VRRTLSLLLGAALCAPPAAAHAQRAARLSVAIGGTAPTGTTGSFLQLGYHAQANLELQVPRLPFVLRLEGMFHELDFERDESDDKLRVAAGVVNGVWATNRREGPFLTAGAGYYRVAPTEERTFTTIYGRSEANAGVNLGFGLRFAHAGFSTYGEVRYHRVFDDAQTQLVPFSFGITF
jgi:hypothetical protein